MSPQPRPNMGRARVLRQLLADLAGREANGRATYGRPLETFNSRDQLTDLYEELLDAVQYTCAWRMQIRAWLQAQRAPDGCGSVPVCILRGWPCDVHAAILDAAGL